MSHCPVLFSKRDQRKASRVNANNGSRKEAILNHQDINTG
jgi:hypothetical protein